MKHWADHEPSQWRPSLDAADIEALEQAYANATRLGFLGPKELDRLWERHLDDVGRRRFGDPSQGSH